MLLLFFFFVYKCMLLLTSISFEVHLIRRCEGSPSIEYWLHVFGKLGFDSTNVRETAQWKSSNPIQMKGVLCCCHKSKRKNGQLQAILY